METGNILIAVGIGALTIGLALKFAPALLNWFGNLPGDIHIETTTSRIFIPVTSMIVVSLLLTLIANLFSK